MINAYRDTLAYREKYPDEVGWASKYSYFDEIHKRGDLREWIEHRGNRERLMEWIYRQRIRTGMDIRKLPLILNDKYATNLLNRSSAERAYAYLAKKDPRLSDDFYRKVSDVIKTIRRIDAKQVVLAARDPNRARLVRSLSDSSLLLASSIEKLQKPKRRAVKRGN
jgi:flagellar biosynthesis component FlhA